MKLATTNGKRSSLVVKNAESGARLSQNAQYAINLFLTLGKLYNHSGSSFTHQLNVKCNDPYLTQLDESYNKIF